MYPNLIVKALKFSTASDRSCVAKSLAAGPNAGHQLLVCARYHPTAACTERKLLSLTIAGALLLFKAQHTWSIAYKTVSHSFFLHSSAAKYAIVTGIRGNVLSRRCFSTDSAGDVGDVPARSGSRRTVPAGLNSCVRVFRLRPTIWQRGAMPLSATARRH